MRILIFGGDGMLGHQLLESWRERHDVWVTLRQSVSAYAQHAHRFGKKAVFDVDVRRLEAVVGVVAAIRPDAVVNAAGIVKQRPDASDAIRCLELNALFPHRLAQVCAAAHVRMIHLSTDCVFSGRKGGYVEADVPDAEDLYGRTKLLGEVTGAHCLTFRTSIIGLELGGRSGLIEWFLAQRGSIKGFRRAIYSGLTTAEMARAIEHVLVQQPKLAGLWHLSSNPISKYDLLTKLSGLLCRGDVEIVPDDEFVCDRSLDSRALQHQLKYRVPSWDSMLDELALMIRDRNASST